MTLTRAETLAAALVGRPVRTYLGLEVRVVRIAQAVAVVANARGGECARVALADLQAGLDALDAEGEVAVTLTALGPRATYVAAMLVEVEGAVFGDAPARVMVSRHPDLLVEEVEVGEDRPRSAAHAAHRALRERRDLLFAARELGA